jgi:hypothetical protein
MVSFSESFSDICISHNFGFRISQNAKTKISQDVFFGVGVSANFLMPAYGKIDERGHLHRGQNSGCRPLLDSLILPTC